MGEVAVCPEDGRLSIWYARPAPHLAPYITAYDAYRADLPPGEEAADVFPPGWAAIRVMPRREPWGARLFRRRFDPAPDRALFGPTSYAGFSRFGRGRMACAGLTPLGWARFVRRDASRFANRIGPLDAVWPDAAPALADALGDADDPAAVFDRFFTGLLERTEPEDPVVAELLPLLLDPTVLTIAELSARLGISPRALGRVSTVHFGFTPKLLLRRARFMRAMIDLLRAERGSWAPLVVRAGYHDQSHFVRDCQLFLGEPMSAFVQRRKPLFEASLRLRATVLGVPAQALHPLPEG